MNTRVTKVPAIPAPTNSNDLEFKKAVKSVIDVREGSAGDPLDANVTLRNLSDAGFLSRTSVPSVVAIGPGSLPPGYVPPDLTPPPAPTGLAQSASITSIFLSWDVTPIGYASNHGYTEVWRSATNVLGSAVMIGTSNSIFYVDPLGSTGTAFYYWIRYRSAADVTGPYNGASGLLAQTGLIGNVDLGPLIVQAGNLAAGAVDATKFVSTIEPVSIALGALPTTLSTRAIFLASDGKLYRWSGTAYVSTVPTADLLGLVADAQIAALAASKITGTLTNSQISDLAATKITGALTDAQIADLAAAKLTGSIVGTQIANDAITTPKIFAGSITTAKIAANAVTAGEIAADAITSAKIFAGAITTAKIAADAVTANEIAANAVTAAKINSGAVTAAKIAANTITAGQIAANTITAGQIAAATITTAEIAADAITAGQIAAGSVTAAKIAANAIAVGSAAIQNGAIVNAMIANATIDSAKIATLSAALLTVGDGSIGGNLKSASFAAGSGFTPGTGWLLTPGGSLHASSATIYGTIYATAGVFAGSLSAATGSFAGSLSAATGSFAGSLSAATGSFGGTLTVGTTPAVSGTTMTGTGGVINSGGTFALGNATTNISFNGTTLTLNGQVVKPSNLDLAGSFSASVSGTLTGTAAPGTPRVLGTKTVSVTGGVGTKTYAWSIREQYNAFTGVGFFLANTESATVSVQANCVTNDEFYGTVQCVVTDANGLTATASFLVVGFLII